MKTGNKKSKGINTIDGDRFKEMLETSLSRLEQQKSLVDSLNVFPVPDGDTGTNMYLTMQEAVEETKNSKSNRIDDICDSMSRGALMGARGNSGVILSQLLRGFAQAVEGNKLMSAEDLADALKNASKVAYKGVLKPVEGTILTVSRKAADGAKKGLKKSDDTKVVLEETIEAANIALNKTPEQLPVLKEAEVVDAGGQGYIFILEGMLQALKGEVVYSAGTTEVTTKTPRTHKQKEEYIKYTFCTQLLIHLDKEDGQKEIDRIKKELNNYGDSLMVVGSDEVIKIHIHTNHPGVILEYGLKIGIIDDIKIDNMKSQHQDMIYRDKPELKVVNDIHSFDSDKSNGPDIKKAKEKNQKPIKRGIITVAAGEGIKSILNELGADEVIFGGQSMNPSTNDFVQAIENLNAKEIIIFPNNKNVVSAARQAAELEENKTVRVIPTRSFTEAIAAMMHYNNHEELDILVKSMDEERENVRTAQITIAVKDSKVQGLDIKEGDVIGLIDGDIKVKGNDYERVVVKLFEESLDDEELITIYYGEEVSEDDAVKLRNKLLNRFDEIDEIEIYAGEQPLYPYIISLE
ncbi:MAG: DAK2 domain-containing protein [Bacillota bacterium]